MTWAALWRIGPSSSCGAVVHELVGRSALGRVEDLSSTSIASIARSVVAHVRLLRITKPLVPRRTRGSAPAVPPAFTAPMAPMRSWSR